jgi:hypothetical protein
LGSVKGRKFLDYLIEMDMERGVNYEIIAIYSSLYIIYKKKVKVKLSLCFNRAPRREGILGEWRYSSTDF